MITIFMPARQVEGCGCNLSGENVKKYLRRNRICELHHKELVVVTKGQPSRYCQQVSGSVLVNHLGRHLLSLCWDV